MKIFGRRRPSKEELAQQIAELEADLGLDDKSVLAEVEKNRLARTSRRRGAVILDAPLARLHNAIADPAFEPPFKWAVEDAKSVQFMATSACAPVTHVRRSRVVLPASVRA